jgi:hypothetical protein
MPETKVKTSDGRIVKVTHPEGATNEQIFSYVAKNYQPKSEPGFFGRIGNRVSESGKSIENIVRDVPNRNPLTSSLGIISEGANLGLAFPAEVISTAGRQALKAVTPEGRAAAKSVADYVSDSAVGDVARDYFRKIQESAQRNPDIAKSALYSANIAGSYFGGKGVTKVVSPVAGDVIDAGAKAIGKIPEAAAPKLKSFGEKQISAAAQIRKQKRFDELASLLEPDVLSSEKKVSDIVSGKYFEDAGGVRRWSPDRYGETTIKNLEKTGVSSKNSFLKNQEIVSSAARKEAERMSGALDTLIKKDKAPMIPSGAVIDRVSSLTDAIKTNAFYPEEGLKPLAQAVNQIDILLSNRAGVTAKDLWDIRKSFDDAATVVKKKVLSDDAAKPLDNAVRAVRNELNKMIQEKYPDAKILDSLQKQSHLLGARDLFALKSLREPATPIARKYSSVAKYISENPASSIANMAVIAGVPASAYAVGPLAALLAGTGYAGYRGYRAATGPTVKDFIGRMSRGAGEMLSPTQARQIGYEPKTNFVFTEKGAKKLSASEAVDFDLIAKRYADMGVDISGLKSSDIKKIKELEKLYGQSELGRFMIENRNVPLRLIPELFKGVK